MNPVLKMLMEINLLQMVHHHMDGLRGLDFLAIKTSLLNMLLNNLDQIKSVPLQILEIKT